MESAMNWIELAIVPIVGGLLGVLGWYLRSSVETIRIEKEKLQDERRQIYTQILEPYIRIFAGAKNPRETKKAISQITSFEYRKASFELSLMGSDDVVRAVNELIQHTFRLERDGASSRPEELLIYWGRVLIAIRRDLGGTGTKLTEIDMLKVHIKDIDQLVRS